MKPINLRFTPFKINTRRKCNGCFLRVMLCFKILHHQEVVHWFNMDQKLQMWRSDINKLMKQTLDKWAFFHGSCCFHKEKNPQDFKVAEWQSCFEMPNYITTQICLHFFAFLFANKHETRVISSHSPRLSSVAVMRLCLLKKINKLL